MSEIVKTALKYSLIFRGEEYILEPAGRVTKVTTEGKESRKTSLNGTIHQAFMRPNLKMAFSWEIVNFSFCEQILEIFNDYNISQDLLYLKRQKVEGEEQTFEIVMSQPNVSLTEIIATGEKWGSLDVEVMSKTWQALSF